MAVAPLIKAVEEELNVTRGGNNGVKDDFDLHEIRVDVTVDRKVTLEELKEEIL